MMLSEHKRIWQCLSLGFFFSLTANQGLAFSYFIRTVFTERSAAPQSARGEAPGWNLNLVRAVLTTRPSHLTSNWKISSSKEKFYDNLNKEL